MQKRRALIQPRAHGRGPFATLAALQCLALAACGSGGSDGRGGDTCQGGCTAGFVCESGTCLPVQSEDVGFGRDVGQARDAAVDDTGEGLGPMDGGAADFGTADTGIGLCAPSSSRCQAPAACGVTRPPPSNCDFCPPDHRSLCFEGRCETPAVLEPTDTQEVSFVLEGIGPTALRSLVGVVLAQQTSGGAALTCDDVVNARFDLQGMCLNVLTSRLITISQAGQSYTFTFGTFPGGVPVLLLVYGFGDVRSSGSPIGVSCTSHEAGEPGSGGVRLVGSPMRPLPK